MATPTEVGIQDIAGVKSRVSWGAIVGGSVVALATTLVLGQFFAGIGLSLTKTDLSGESIAWASIVMAILSVIIGLYVGGCTACVLTAGETRREAMIYGVLTWATVTSFVMLMVALGMTGGYFAVLGAASTGGQVADNVETNKSWEQLAKDAGVKPETIDNIKETDLQDVKAEVQDVNKDKVAEKAGTGGMIAAWSTLVATLFALGASVLGGIAGAGPRFRVATVVRT